MGSHAQMPLLLPAAPITPYGLANSALIGFSPTVVSYRTPSGTGTGTLTVVPTFPAVCPDASTARNAV
jgi:hypothetical protein